MNRALLFLLTAFSLLAQQTVNNFTVKTNLTAGNAVLTNFTGTAVNLTGSLTNVTVDSVPSAHVISGNLMPPVGGTNYWTIGDSQTFGEFAQVYAFTDGSKRMFAPFRYANILASDYGLNLTNLAISGMRFSYTATATANGLAQASQIPADWTGLTTIALGFNDATAENYGTPLEANNLFVRAADALLSKLYASTWTAANGTNNLGTADPSWSTTGTVSVSGTAGRAQFPYGSPTTDQTAILTLIPGQTVTFSATNPAVWLWTSTDGGQVSLFQSTNYVSSLNADSADTSTWSMPVVMRGQGLSGTFTVTNVSGTNRVLAVGSIATPAEASRKTVIMAGPIGFENYTTRYRGVASMISSAIESAVNLWAGYNAGFADWSSRIDELTMVESGDLNHPNPFGHRAMVEALKNAKRAEARGGIKVPGQRWTDRGLQVFGGVASLDQYIPQPSIFSSHVSGTGYVDSYDPSSSSYLTLNLRALLTKISQGALQVVGTTASAANYHVGNALTLATSGGVGYVDAVLGNGTSTAAFIPIYVRGQSVNVSEGALNVRGAASSSADYIAGDTLSFGDSGGIGYIDSFTWDGANVTYKPINARAKRVHVSQGPLQVSGSASAVTDYATNAAVILSEAAGTGYVDALYTDGTNATYLPIQIRSANTVVKQGGLQVVSETSTATNFFLGNSLTASVGSGAANIQGTSWDGTNVTYIPLVLGGETTHVKTGPFQVSGSASAVSAYDTNASVVISESSGTGYVDAIYTDGVSATYLPLQFRASSVTIPRSGGLVVGENSGSRGIKIVGAASGIRYVDFLTGSSLRWRAQANGTAESGTNAGSDFVLQNYSDAGSSLGTPPLVITRSTGLTTLSSLSVSGTAAVFPTTTTLAYSGTNVTQTATNRAYYQSALVLTNDCLLTITGTDGASGSIVFKPDSSTSYTVYLDTGIKLLGGGTSFVVTNSASELVNFEWKQVYVNGVDRILANKAVYP